MNAVYHHQYGSEGLVSGSQLQAPVAEGQRPLLAVGTRQYPGLGRSPNFYFIIPALTLQKKLEIHRGRMKSFLDTTQIATLPILRAVQDLGCTGLKYNWPDFYT